MIEKATETGQDIWNQLQSKGKEIIEKAKETLVPAEDAATAFLYEVYPSVSESIGRKIIENNTCSTITGKQHWNC